jgi:hypothetical protein
VQGLQGAGNNQRIDRETAKLGAGINNKYPNNPEIARRDKMKNTMIAASIILVSFIAYGVQSLHNTDHKHVNGMKEMPSYNQALSAIR